MSRGHWAWNEGSLANVGASVGPKGKCRRISSGVMKEAVELTSDLKGRGVTKPGQLLLGIAVAKEGGARKRDRGLDGFCPVATEPGFEPKGGGAEEECEGVNTPYEACAQSWGRAHSRQAWYQVRGALRVQLLPKVQAVWICV